MVQRIESSMIPSQMMSGSQESIARASEMTKTASGAGPKTPEQTITVTTEQLKDAVAKLNEFMDQSDRGLSFTMDETLNRPIVSVIDKNSGEVIRKIPSEEVITAVKNMEALRGILFDQMG